MDLPRLVMLDMQAAFGLKTIHFLKRHALGRELPDDFEFDKELKINRLNASLSGQAVRALESHPRVQDLGVGLPDGW